jgi:N-acetylglucosamine kinase-like BadF-type ATPase
MHENNFFIGIDSGGTKCELLISGNKGNTILKKKFKALHYSVHGKKIISEHLSEIISSSLNEKKLDLKNCRGICIGLAGAREIKDRLELEKQIKKLTGYKKIAVESDALIALYGAFKGNDGLILICGTGSILYGIAGGKFHRIGGWGRILGDYGSGYEIGKLALKHLARNYDNGIKLSRLSKEIEKKFYFTKHNILKNIYHENFNVQNLAPVVIELARKKDKDAEKIIDKAVDELTEHFNVFFKSSGLKKKIDVALSGSIIESDNILSKKLIGSIKKNFGNINLINKAHTPAEGAILLAKNKFNKN